jgi:hypothetical protein
LVRKSDIAKHKKTKKCKKDMNKMPWEQFRNLYLYIKYHLIMLEIKEIKP